jgi:NAD(P)-dependent dehydrogenase (short-subunit alcohol dehydrogenase family)
MRIYKRAESELPMTTTIAGKSVLVTGASRGIGHALVEEALRRGASRVYAAARHPVGHPAERVTYVTLDVTDAEQVQQAVARSSRSMC